MSENENNGGFFQVVCVLQGKLLGPPVNLEKKYFVINRFAYNVVLFSFIFQHYCHEILISKFDQFVRSSSRDLFFPCFFFFFFRDGIITKEIT